MPDEKHPLDDPDKELDERERQFCENVLSGMAQYKAYHVVYGCSESSAKSHSSVKIKEPHIRKYIQKRKEEVQERTNVTMKRTLLELARIAYSDIREFVNWDANGVVFVPSNELTADEAAAIASVKSRTRRVTDKDGNVTETTELEVKTHSKLDAIEKLNRVQGLYQADRMNDADRQHDLLTTVLWRYVMALHMEQGLSVREAWQRAERNPEVVEKWGKEVMLLPSESSS